MCDSYRWCTELIHFGNMTNNHSAFRHSLDIWQGMKQHRLLKTALYISRFNPLTPNNLYMSHTAPLTSKRCILYIYSTNVGTEYFKHALYSPFFSLQNAVCFIMLNLFGSCIIHILYTGCAEIKKNNSSAKGLMITMARN